MDEYKYITSLEQKQEETDHIKQTIRETLYGRLTNATHCSYNVKKGCAKLGKADAIKQPYIRLNSPKLVSCIAFDIDHEFKDTCIRELEANGLPQPNFVVVNECNGHSHWYYMLNCPVSTSEKSSVSASNYLKAIIKILQKKFNADEGFNNILVKNPFFDKKEGFERGWAVIYYHCHFFELSELANSVAANLYQLKGFKNTVQNIAFSGRNVEIFYYTRHWAYQNYSKHPSLDTWLDAINFKAQELNQVFINPLPDKEIAYIAKSIFRFTVEKFGAIGQVSEGFSNHQRIRQKKSVAKRNKNNARYKDAACLLYYSNRLSIKGIQDYLQKEFEKKFANSTIYSWVSSRKNDFLPKIHNIDYKQEVYNLKCNDYLMKVEEIKQAIYKKFGKLLSIPTIYRYLNLFKKEASVDFRQKTREEKKMRSKEFIQSQAKSTAELLSLNDQEKLRFAAKENNYPISTVMNVYEEMTKPILGEQKELVKKACLSTLSELKAKNLTTATKKLLKTAEYRDMLLDTLEKTWQKNYHCSFDPTPFEKHLYNHVSIRRWGKEQNKFSASFVKNSMLFIEECRKLGVFSKSKELENESLQKLAGRFERKVLGMKTLLDWKKIVKNEEQKKLKSCQKDIEEWQRQGLSNVEIVYKVWERINLHLNADDLDRLGSFQWWYDDVYYNKYQAKKEEQNKVAELALNIKQDYSLTLEEIIDDLKEKNSLVYNQWSTLHLGRWISFKKSEQLYHKVLDSFVV